MNPIKVAHELREIAKRLSDGAGLPGEARGAGDCQATMRGEADELGLLADEIEEGATPAERRAMEYERRRTTGQGGE